MSMSTIQHSTAAFHRSMARFIRLVHLPQLLRRANIHKTRGVHVTDLFEWALSTIFARYSFERADADPRFTTKTVRNCLNDPRTNWQRLVLLVAVSLINYVAHFAESHRAQVLILDDSLFKQEFSKHTELLSVYLTMIINVITGVFARSRWGGAMVIPSCRSALHSCHRYTPRTA